MTQNYRTGLRVLGGQAEAQTARAHQQKWHAGVAAARAVTLERKSSRERPALRRVRDRRGGDLRLGRRRPVTPGRLRARPRQSGARRRRDRVARHLAAFCRGTSTSGSASPAPTARCSPSRWWSRCSPSSPRSRRTSARSGSPPPTRMSAAQAGSGSFSASPTSSSRSASWRISCWRPGATAEPALCRRGSGPACCSASGARCWRHSRRSRVSRSRTTAFDAGMPLRDSWACCRSRSRRWRSPTTCTGGCATCSSPTRPSAARTSPSSPRHCSTARRR